MTTNAPITHLIKTLSLIPHPEGGFYKELYRDKKLVKPKNSLQEKNASTAIYYLLSDNNFSAFHRLTSDESWHYYEGNSLLLVYEITESGELKIHRLGSPSKEGEYFTVIPAGSWFGSCLEEQTEESYALVGCTVAPGFSFEDFEMAKRANLLNQFPQHKNIIKTLTRN